MSKKQLLIKIPTALHKILKLEAKAQETTMTEVIIRLLCREFDIEFED